MKQPPTELTYTLAHLWAEAVQTRGVSDELAQDLRACMEHAVDELAAFHRTHDIQRAPEPAWWATKTKGGAS